MLVSEVFEPNTFEEPGIATGIVREVLGEGPLVLQTDHALEQWDQWQQEAAFTVALLDGLAIQLASATDEP